MSKKVLVISTSLRKNSNSERLAAAFASGAREAGHETEEISLSGKEINFCKGCLACQKTRRCVIRDDMDAILPKMTAADVIALATPIYYYEMSGQMKTLLDRGNPMFAGEYAFRDIYLLAASAEDDPHTIDKAVTGLSGWIECFSEAKLSGALLGGGVTGPGEIEGKEILAKAAEMGRGI